MKPSLAEMAIEYVTYPSLFPDWEENKLAHDIKWNMLQQMLNHFPDEAVFAAIGKALDIKKLLGA